MLPLPFDLSLVHFSSYICTTFLFRLLHNRGATTAAKGYVYGLVAIEHVVPVA